jgi:hypothetical protein
MILGVTKELTLRKDKPTRGVVEIEHGRMGRGGRWMEWVMMKAAGAR